MSVTHKTLFIHWPLFLLVIPCVSGFLALTGHGFVYKAGVAGSGILLLLFLYNRKLLREKDIWFILAAFVFSIIGDWFLSNRHGSTMRFVYGILFFFLAHVGYLFYSLVNGKLKRSFTLVLLVFYLVFFVFVIMPSLSEKTLFAAVFVYLVISCLSLGAAFGIALSPIQKWTYFVGIVLVLFSDTIIALREFAGYKELNFLILPTYYLAQISITFSLLLNLIRIKQA